MRLCRLLLHEAERIGWLLWRRLLRRLATNLHVGEHVLLLLLLRLRLARLAHVQTTEKIWLLLLLRLLLLLGRCLLHESEAALGLLSRRSGRP